MNAKALAYNPALDGLRAVAILLVVAYHSRVPGFGGGFVGVDLFFVLSGFLITGILAGEIRATGRLSFLGFYAKRALRLAPPLVLMLLAFLAAAPFVWPEVAAGLSAAVAFFYLSDYVHAFTPYPEVIHHTWSLAIEEHFYLLWPLLLLWLMRRGKASPGLFLGLWIAASLWRVANLAFFEAWNPVYYRFDTHASGLILGSWLALADFRVKEGSMQNLCFLAGALGLAVATVALQWNTVAPLVGGFPFVEIASVLLIVSVAGAEGLPARLCAARPMVFVGLLSYSIYLWHYPIARALREDAEWPVVFAVTLAGSLAVSSLSWFAMEKPLRALRHRLQFKPRQALDSARPLPVNRRPGGRSSMVERKLPKL